MEKKREEDINVVENIMIFCWLVGSSVMVSVELQLILDVLVSLKHSILLDVLLAVKDSNKIYIWSMSFTSNNVLFLL